MLIAETGKGRFLMESRTYYYARVSSREQNLDRQFAAFAALGAQERDIIADKESGKSINRSGYTALKSALLRRGDTLVIKSLDRLSRNKEDTKRELQYFIGVVLPDQPLGIVGPLAVGDGLKGLALRRMRNFIGDSHRSFSFLLLNRFYVFAGICECAAAR